MRFIVQLGTDPIARADAALLRALGLPGGGAVRIGSTHCRVSPGEVPSPTAILLGTRTMRNADVAVGDAVDVIRAPLSEAVRVALSGDDQALDGRHLARSLRGLPVTTGDVVGMGGSHGEAGAIPQLELRVVEVEPGDAGLVGSTTVVYEQGEGPIEATGQRGEPTSIEGPSIAEALLAGLDTEVEVMTGWLSLLTSPHDLPETWGLPTVAGVVLEGPAGCGKSELVTVAASRAQAQVREVSLDLVFTPGNLLERLEAAVKTVAAPCVLFVDHVDAVLAVDAMFATQAVAILRWFLDAVAERPGVACVLGTSTADRLPPAVSSSPLLPRTLTIPPPNVERRVLLIEAALARVPAEGIDFDHLAARAAGFSGADIMAAVVHASAMIAPNGGVLTQGMLAAAVDDTIPSLGTTGLGEIPSSGFERVANLDEVKQRLTESVIWQIREPERFARLGIEPPRGLLLHGPPGTGKTFVIRALAHEAGAAFLNVKGAELLDKYVGESERAVREIFARARALAPAILFFDEIDALAPVRGESSNSVTDSVVAALLTEMDGVTARGQVFVIGATNRRDLIDPALLRAGRLETQLRLDLPGRESRAAFLSMGEVPFAADVDLARIADVTDGLSFADLSGMLREAALQALRGDPRAMAVSTADLEHALKRLPG